MVKTAKAPAAGDEAAQRDGEKLQKVLARSGLGSRREMERWIEKGRVRINGKVAQLGDRVSGKHAIEVDGAPLPTGDSGSTRCLLYHKPTGQVCSRKDPEGRRTVFEKLPKVKGGRWISIGRLDYNTSGLLLFTTDGELANKLMHPAAGIEREYLVRVMGEVSDDNLKAMREGVMLDDGIARFSDIQEGGGEGLNSWYYVVLMEGRNREVRRLWESQGLTVSRLKRVRFGDLLIPSKVKKGQWQELGAREISRLYQLANMPEKAALALTPDGEKRQKRQAGKRGGAVLRTRGEKRKKPAKGDSEVARKGAKKHAPGKDKSKSGGKGTKGDHSPGA